MASNSNTKTEYQLLHRRNSQGPANGSEDLDIIRHENVLDPEVSDDLSESDFDLEEHELSKEVETEAIGAAKIESITAVWTPTTKRLFVIGQSIFVIMFSFASTTTHSYVSYALSDFHSLSKQGSLDVTSQIISMSLKLPVAKLSDVLGRAETYCILTILDMLSEIIRALAPTYTIFGIGWMCYVAGHGGFSILNMILISDVTSMRIRALAGSALYSPFLVTPWISGQLVDQVVGENGIGWRWGYGMFTIIIPLGAAPLILVLFYLQRKAVKKGLSVTKKMSWRGFCEQTDLVGLVLLCGGFAMVLLPITRLSQPADGGGSWRAPWVVALIVVGVGMLGWFIGHERYHAKYPVVPLRYFGQKAIVFTWLLSCFDSIAFGSTHTYLFPWSVAAHNYSAKKALFLSYTNGVTTCLIGLLAGIVMYRMRSYKRMAVIASVIRLVGYALMLRLRTANSSDFELFLVQMIQGIGTGIIEVTGFVAAQIVVSHAELAQVTALSSLGSHLGDAVGAAIAGGIYTSKMKGRLRAHLGSAVSETQIADIYDSITGDSLPEWGSANRIAVTHAYSDIMGYVTIIGLVASFPIILFALLLPDNRLGDGKNLAAEGKSEDLDSVPLRRAKTTR